MPRAARGLVGGQVCHLLNRGNGRANVFHKPEDFAAFVNLPEDWTSFVDAPLTGREMNSLRRSLHRQVPFGSGSGTRRACSSRSHLSPFPFPISREGQFAEVKSCVREL